MSAVEEAGTWAAALGIGAVVLVVVGIPLWALARAVLRAVHARQAARERHRVPVGVIRVPDSVWGYHDEPAEDGQEQQDDGRAIVAYCPGCRAIVEGLELETGGWLCWRAGHINEEEGTNV